jgi:peroxiredoxin
MALEYSTASVFGSEAPPFSLRGVDDRTYTLDSFRNSKGLLVVFMCNHCPYVIAVHERLSKLAREFGPKGIAVIGINSNDPAYKEADSFPNMKKTALEWKLPFPYLFDEAQSVARAYDAVCTPDPYLYEQVDGRFLLRFRGRIDDSWQDESKVKKQDLRLAMEALLSGGEFDPDPVPSMGCSIKWKELTAEALRRKKP